MSILASRLIDEDMVLDQPPRPPKAPPWSPLIRVPLDKLPEQQPPTPPEEPEIIRFPPPIAPEMPPPLPPEDRTE